MSTQQESPVPRIVIGVDGSPPSKAALRWAVRQADLTGAYVEAVSAWHFPVAAYGIPFAPVGTMEDTDYGEIARELLTAAITETVDPGSTVKVSMTVAEGSPAQVLLDAAKGADLLVVGSRGHGGFTGALLGSVSQHCAYHATCPLVVVRAARTR